MMTTRKLTISAMVVALYIVLIYVTQGISFGAYQIRIATSLYALAYAFPFLIIPMGIGNLISNFLFGGLGILDMVGGFGVGVLTTSLIVLMRRFDLTAWWVALPIILVPALCVPLWLSPLIGVPYWALVINLLVGQTIPGIVGATLVKALVSRRSMVAFMGNIK
ncbi:QueT transporter family protein [Veillonella caviae]|uniref:QueT transporter family protein n=1 Tax=Veillonella caviae TaxID=248316 RepID=UPI000F8EA73E|nr:QueT transporter family protein [Veillonella caviae]MCF0157535.1 QueT transporter family protein [Veillonella sp.]MCI5708218.1 QueT transporter family protein [Veillonella caviae]MCI6407600.1 QueT transporter family protein [Veillonella caviae]MCI7694401.1 QueT transporter family protein [Veillonella caviae]MDD7290975.1 QueT transporter family protein [Veillonella caviae]